MLACSWSSGQGFLARMVWGRGEGRGGGVNADGGVLNVIELY